MQIILDTPNKSVIRLETGEECLGALKVLALEKNASFNFSVIGAAATVELGYYHLEEQRYFSREFGSSHIEVISVVGNVAWDEAEPIVHAHGVFSNEKYECFGGHVMKIIISATGEVAIDWLPEKINKKHDPKTGLKLLCS